VIDYDSLLCDICYRRQRNKGKTKAQFILVDGEKGWERAVCHAHLNEGLTNLARRLDQATLRVTIIKIQQELDTLKLFAEWKE
jgi:hypothetical protein